MTSEVVVVVGMDIQVGCLGHMVGEEDGVEETEEDMVQTMRGRIQAMGRPNGIQDLKTGRMVGTVSLVLKSKAHQARKLSLVIGEQVEVVVVAVAATLVDGAKEAVVGEGEVGTVRVQMMVVLGLKPGIVDGGVVVEDLRKVWQAQAGNGDMV